MRLLPGSAGQDIFPGWQQQSLAAKPTKSSLTTGDVFVQLNISSSTRKAMKDRPRLKLEHEYLQGSATTLFSNVAEMMDQHASKLLLLKATSSQGVHEYDSCTVFFVLQPPMSTSVDLARLANPN